MFKALCFSLIVAGSCCAAAGAEEARALAAQYPEGPLWQGERLYYAEMRRDRVMRVEGDRVSVFYEQEGCGPSAIAPYGEGFVVLCHVGRYLVAVDAAGRQLRRWNDDRHRRNLEQPNDASADGKGGVYFSAPREFARGRTQNGRVMHLSADGVVRRATGPLAYPNGVHVQGDVLYVSEHLAGLVLRYDILGPGRLGQGRILIELARVPRPARYPTPYALSGPDGLEIGPDGNLYVAIYGEGRLLKFTPEGAYLGSMELPARYLTNIAFGKPGVALTGAFDNAKAPFPGEVRILDKLH